MHLFGVMLAAYYDWCVRLTKTEPGWWQTGLACVQFAVLLGAMLMPFGWGIALYLICLALIVPAFAAAGENKNRDDGLDTPTWMRRSRIRQLVARHWKG